ncbi:MAG: RNA methyltransferase [Bacteroidota bacterium]
MLSKAQNKYIRSLTQQKFREEYKVFTAEGEKIAAEWLRSSSKLQMILATEEWASEYDELISRHPEAELHIVKDHELSALSSLQTANQVMLVAALPVAKSMPDFTDWCIALDNLQDPGNMGTVIRIADWFGINQVICSPGCVDVYNPKVVQSAMGGHLRVDIYKADLTTWLTTTKLPRIAATLNGKNIYEVAKPAAGVLLIGNESRGLSPDLVALADMEVMIPRGGGAESLNAGVSAGILCALLVGG